MKKANGSDLVFPPVSFEVMEITVSVDPKTVTRSKQSKHRFVLIKI